MYKPAKAQYSIRTCPSNEPEYLESLLNSMADEGWELYSMHEVDTDEGYQYNCIFLRDALCEEIDDDSSEFLGFKSKMERIMNPVVEPLDMCIDIQKKIKDKRLKINQIKSLLDSTAEDSRADLNAEISKTISELNELKQKLLQVLSPDIMENKLGEAKLSISLSEELLDIVNPDSEVNLISQIVSVRQHLTETLGYILPKVKFNNDDTLQANEFSINVRGIPAINAAAYPGFNMYFRDELNISKLPKNTIKDVDYITGKQIVWIEQEKTKDFWAEGLNAREFVGRLLEYITIKHIDELLDYSDVNRYIEIVGTQNLYLIENIIPDFVSIAELKYILANLIKEKVSIKDILYIFEKINDFADEPSKEDLLGRIRISLARQISKSIANKNGIILAFELSPSSKGYLEKQTQSEDIIKIDSSRLEKIVSNIQKGIKKYMSDSKEVILICPFSFRHVFFMVMSQYIPNIRVIAKEEIISDYPLEISEYV